MRNEVLLDAIGKTTNEHLAIDIWLEHKERHIVGGCKASDDFLQLLVVHTTHLIEAQITHERLAQLLVIAEGCRSHTIVAIGTYGATTLDDSLGNLSLGQR